MKNVYVMINKSGIKLLKVQLTVQFQNLILDVFIF